ncbi:MAG: signal peptidase II [Acidobacteriota bacterium]|nr:signal peptidase II [Acidobacteriota bacterium]
MTRRVMVVISVVIIALDQVTKQLIRAEIALNDTLEVIPGFFNLVHVRNTGAAFGILNVTDLAYKRFLMTGIASVALVAIAFYVRQVASHETLSRVGLALILGGAVGNLIDRAAMGYVVDFVDVYWKHVHFWAFNVADSAITVGACLLIVDMFWGPRPEQPDDVPTSV